MWKSEDEMRTLERKIELWEKKIELHRKLNDFSQKSKEEWRRNDWNFWVMTLQIGKDIIIPSGLRRTRPQEEWLCGWAKELFKHCKRLGLKPELLYVSCWTNGISLEERERRLRKLDEQDDCSTGERKVDVMRESYLVGVRFDVFIRRRKRKRVGRGEIGKAEKERATAIIENLKKEIAERPENDRIFLDHVYIMPIKSGRDIAIPKHGCVLHPRSEWLRGVAKIVYRYCVEHGLYPFLADWHGEDTIYLAEGEEFTFNCRSYVMSVCPWMSRSEKAEITAYQRVNRSAWMSVPRRRRK